MTNSNGRPSSSMPIHSVVVSEKVVSAPDARVKETVFVLSDEIKQQMQIRCDLPSAFSLFERVERTNDPR